MDKLISVATKSIILLKSKALIIQRSSDAKIDPDIWEFVGGTLEFGESLKECLRREIWEEINIDVEIQELLYATTFIINELRQAVILTYLCTTTSEQIALSSEHKNYMWASKDQMKALLAKPIIQDLEENSVWERLRID